MALGLLTDGLQEEVERLARLNVAGFFAFNEDARHVFTDERDARALDSQHRPFTYSDNAYAGVCVDELREAFVARLAAMIGQLLVRVVRIYLEGDEAERVQTWRLDDGHVVRRTYRRACDVRASAPADVRRARRDALGDSLDDARLVESAQKVESVSAADGDCVGARNRGARFVGLVN